MPSTALQLAWYRLYACHGWQRFLLCGCFPELSRILCCYSICVKPTLLLLATGTLWHITTLKAYKSSWGRFSDVVENYVSTRRLMTISQRGVLPTRGLAVVTGNFLITICVRFSPWKQARSTWNCTPNTIFSMAWFRRPTSGTLAYFTRGLRSSKFSFESFQHPPLTRGYAVAATYL